MTLDSFSIFAILNLRKPAQAACAYSFFSCSMKIAASCQYAYIRRLKTQTVEKGRRTGRAKPRAQNESALTLYHATLNSSPKASPKYSLNALIRYVPTTAYCSGVTPCAACLCAMRTTAGTSGARSSMCVA